MNFTIEQRRFTLRSEYDISGPGCNYYAQKKFFSFLDKLKLLAGNRDIVARVKSRFYLFRPKYVFELSDGTLYRFECVKLWKGVSKCEGNGERYWLYEHEGLRCSIFQDNRQIAAFTKNRVKIGKGDQYHIRMNADANIVIVICLALTVDLTENERDEASVTFDFGNIGPEEKPFDESWEPS